VVPGRRLAILGKQGAGKGTQAVRLSRHYVIPHISTGDIFRAAVKSGSAFGERAREYMDQGELVPDAVVIGMVRERLAADDARERGFLLDGFPRTVPQAEALEQMLAPTGIDLVVNLDVPTTVVLKRLASRRVCVDCGTNYSTDQPPRVDWVCDVCGGKVVQRDDDTEAAIARRLALYEQQTNPMIAWYVERSRLVTVDGEGDPDEVTARLIRTIDARTSGRVSQRGVASC
jgi:adenylate kinase